MKVYATVDGSEERILVRIQCDGDRCTSSIKPNAEITSSGWTKHVILSSGSEDRYRHVYYYCPQHG